MSTYYLKDGDLYSVEELVHAAKGSQKPRHKYVKREKTYYGYRYYYNLAKKTVAELNNALDTSDELADYEKAKRAVETNRQYKKHGKYLTKKSATKSKGKRMMKQADSRNKQLLKERREAHARLNKAKSLSYKVAATHKVLSKAGKQFCSALKNDNTLNMTMREIISKERGK